MTLQSAHTCPAAGHTVRHGTPRQPSSDSSRLSPRRITAVTLWHVSSHGEHRDLDCATMPQDLTEEATQSSAENIQVCADYSTAAERPQLAFLHSRPWSGGWANSKAKVRLCRLLMTNVLWTVRESPDLSSVPKFLKPTNPQCKT